jgi:hypothetical protein
LKKNLTKKTRKKSLSFKTLFNKSPLPTNQILLKLSLSMKRKRMCLSRPQLKRNMKTLKKKLNKRKNLKLPNQSGMWMTAKNLRGVRRQWQLKTSRIKSLSRRAKPTTIAPAVDQRTSHSAMVRTTKKDALTNPLSLSSRATMRIPTRSRRLVSAAASTTRQRRAHTAMAATKMSTGDQLERFSY